MLRVSLIILVYAFVDASVVSAQSLKQQDQSSVVVTRRESRGKTKKEPRHRIAIARDSAFTVVRVTNTPVLPRYRKIQSVFSTTGRKQTTTTRRDSMLALINRKQDSIVSELKENSPDNDFNRYQRARTNFVNGRNGGDPMKFQWHDVARSRLPEVDERFQLKIKTGLFRKTSYTTDTIPAQVVLRLPELDRHPCEPFDRFYMRKQLGGWGIENIRYAQFSIPNRKIVRKSFDLFFQKNSADVSEVDIQPVRDYLKNNALSILHVRIEGYASVEGDSLLNVKLQQKRAKHLITLLQKYNNEPIGSDTLLLMEAWTAFRQAVRQTQYGWLDTLNNNAVRARINKDTHLLTALEPYLVQHRKASLTITLSSRYAKHEMFDKIKNEFGKLCKPGNNTRGGMTTEGESRMMGIFQYVDKMISNGNARFEDLARLVDECPCAAEASILLFYHVVKIQEQSSPEGASTSFDSLFLQRNWNNIFKVAQNNIMKLIQSAPAELRTRRLRQAVDIQYYMKKYVEQGRLDPEVLCSIRYPDDKLFYGLKLNQYAVMHALSKSYVFSCVGPAGNATTIATTNATEEYFQAFMHQYAATHAKAFKKKAPTFNASHKGDYYYFLRTLFVKGDKSIRDHVITSDNLAEFDLYYLVRENVGGWDPVSNHFYDSAITLKEMDILVARLKRIDQRICKEDPHQLYLDYHLKALIYLQDNFTPGMKDHMRIATTSLEFISEYYRRRVHLLFPRMTLFVVDGLNYFYHLPTAKPSSYYAARILEYRVKTIALDEEELYRWMKLMAFLPQPRHKLVWDQTKK